MSAPGAVIPPRPALPKNTPGAPGTPSAARAGRGRHPLGVRQRIVLVVVASLALASIIIGGAAVLSVRSLLLDRVDEQLGHAVNRSDSALAIPGLPGREPPSFIGSPGMGPGALGAVIVGGQTLYSGYLAQDGTPVTLTPAQEATLAAIPTGGTPQTVDLGTVGHYRVVAQPVLLSSGAGLAPQEGVAILGLPLAEMELTLSQLMGLIAALAGLVLLLTAGAAYVVVRLALRPLDRVAATAAEVSRLSLSGGEEALQVRVPARDADERTEVGRVGASINRMLGHVEDSLRVRRAGEVKLRRFVSDASHELRTPLASIRGYSELAARIGGDLPRDVQYSLDRIGSESIRMTGIVEDLLLLARLDEGRELTAAPVDLTDTLFHAVNDARAAGPEHEVELAVPDTPVRVTGDPARLQQVVLNLLANARVHTPPGTRIDVRLGVDPAGNEAILEVADNGPGIGPELHDHVFERFVRGDASRSRTAGSSGLGLSIVSAVVAAHGGRVDLESEPGRTVFRVILPLAAARTPAG